MHVGNDIVDLASPYVQDKSGDRKFVQRVLTPREQQVLLKCDQPDNLLQVFWAAKESAYKLAARSFPLVSSAPRRYEVCLVTAAENEREVTGQVKTPLGPVYITARHDQNVIHCIGTESCLATKNVICGVERINGFSQPDFCRYSEIQSRMARASARRKIASILSLSGNDITITATNQKRSLTFPEVYVKGKKAGISISLSHDGRFIAYALLCY